MILKIFVDHLIVFVCFNICVKSGNYLVKEKNEKLKKNGQELRGDIRIWIEMENEAELYNCDYGICYYYCY